MCGSDSSSPGQVGQDRKSGVSQLWFVCVCVHMCVCVCVQDGKDAVQMAEERGYDDVLDVLRAPKQRPQPLPKVSTSWGSAFFSMYIPVIVSCFLYVFSMYIRVIVSCFLYVHTCNYQLFSRCFLDVHTCNWQLFSICAYV